MTLNSISTQLELNFSCETPICTEVAPTITASVPQNPPCLDASCTHPQLSLGLDRAHCPDCKAEFHPWSKEYKNALQQPKSAPVSLEYKIGDRVTILSEPPTLLWQIIDLTRTHAQIVSVVEGAPINSDSRRRVALWKLRPSCALPDCSRGRTEPMLDESSRPLEHFSETPADESSRPLEHFSEADESSRPLEHFSEADEGKRPLEHFSEADEGKRPSDSPPVGQRDRKHTPASGWVEKYYVKGRWEHHRYCWQQGHKGKTQQVHIPKESGKLPAVRDAIALGKSPKEIVEFLKPLRDKQSEKCSRGRN